MNSTDKGNRLEDAFYQYLLDQKDRGELIFGAHSPENCRIFKKKSYYCRQREADVQFDIVIELYRTGSQTPHIHIVFECKNHDKSVPETYVNDFSSKIGRIFPHNVKGILVVASRLQSGADKVARNAGMGIVKYDENGLEVVVDRRGASFEPRLVRSQIFSGDNSVKSLKFSAYHDGEYFGSMDQLLASFDPEARDRARQQNEHGKLSVPFLSTEQIKAAARKTLEFAGYESGAVDLVQICRSLSIELQFAERDVFDANGFVVLGSANFSRRVIVINSHSRETRERFTIAHEIGHFQLNHEQYLLAESIIEQDLRITRERRESSSHERLEYQANAFSAELLLPDYEFLKKTAHFRRDLDMRDRGHGYIYVDNQHLNYSIYDELLVRLSNYFEVSKTAIEVKFKKSNMLRDYRNHRPTTVPDPFSNVISPRRS